MILAVWCWSLYYVSFVRLGVGSGRLVRCVVDCFALFRGCLDGCGWCLAGSRGGVQLCIRIKTGKMVGKVIRHTSSSTPSTLYTACCCFTSSSAICRVDTLIDSGDGQVSHVSHHCRHFYMELLESMLPTSRLLILPSETEI